MLSSKTSSRQGPLRQGALRTVWCAAQSDSELNKSHYISINICTAVDIQKASSLTYANLPKPSSQDTTFDCVTLRHKFIKLDAVVMDTDCSESFSASPEQDQQPTYIMPEQGLEFLDSNSANGHGSPTLQIHSTPPPPQTLPEKWIPSHRYDDVTILSNRLMMKRITDSSGILHIRKKYPQDALSSWKFVNKIIKKDSIFFEPLLTGLRSDLCEASRKDFISGKPYLTTHSPNRVVSSPRKFMPSPTGGHDSTPDFGSDTSSLSDQVEATCGRVSDLEPSTDTPVIFFCGRQGVEDSSGPDGPDQLRNSDDGDLSFLAEDDNNLSGELINLLVDASYGY
ncbi:hypothetical protein POM88_033762 [Heracleum sosnowskyi]|uniref:Uncharacterized protein n=1 Tax=Heracleum sosnowskyi TaxID=360622 RepID=A0AAD8HI02_9APIA|nr:hypothetical protein POM88_033762 [Heracleum sosnowskyi]